MVPRHLNLIFITVLILFGTASSGGNEYSSLFNGSDLSGWVNVLGALDTWSVVDESIQAPGTPKSILRTDAQYENYILELDYKTQNPGECAGIIIHSDALPAAGQPWPRGINIQLDTISGLPAISPTGGARIEPAIHSAANTNQYSSTGKEWQHCQIKSRDGHIELKINGKIVATANYASPRKGYIALKSDGVEIQFKNIQIKKIPSSNTGGDV